MDVLAIVPTENWLFSLTNTDYYPFFIFLLCAIAVLRWILHFNTLSKNVLILKSKAVNCIDMLSETEFAEISKTSIQTQTDSTICNDLCENELAPDESNKLKIKNINDELIQVEQQISELKSCTHCFTRGNMRQQKEILINSDISKCEHLKLELEVQKHDLSSLQAHGDQLDLLKNGLDEEKLNSIDSVSKEDVQKKFQDKIEIEQHKLLLHTLQFSRVLEKIIPELENFQFKLQTLNETEPGFSLQNQPNEMHNCYFRHCQRKPYEKESMTYGCNELNKSDANIFECTNSYAKHIHCCLKHVHEEQKIAMEIKQEKAKAERELQMSLCRKDRNKWNYEKANCMIMRAEDAMVRYYQHFNQAQEVLKLREGTCRQFSDTIVKKGYEMLKEQCYRAQNLTVQLDKDLTVNYEEVAAAHSVLEILEKHAVNFFERQKLLNAREFNLMDKMILLHELIEYVERDEQRLCYFLKEMNDSKKKMAAMVKAMDNIEEQARSMKNGDNERVKAELMKVVKQMQYARCLDSSRALKDSENLLSCMTEKISLKPSQLDLLRLKGEVESILSKCQDWSQREKILYIEQLEELGKLTAYQDNFSEHNADSEKQLVQEAVNKPVMKIKPAQTPVHAMRVTNNKYLKDEASALGSPV